MLEPLEVWKVELARGVAHHDVAGTLHLGDEALEFAGEDAPARMRIAYTRIGRVRRLRVSSVLVMDWEEDGAMRRTAFYLSKPPPLHPSDTGETPPAPGLGVGRATRRGQQRRNTYYLATVGTEAKPILKAWLAEVKTRTRAARGG